MKVRLGRRFLVQLVPVAYVCVNLRVQTILSLKLEIVRVIWGQHSTEKTRQLLRTKDYLWIKGE